MRYYRYEITAQKRFVCEAPATKLASPADCVAYLRNVAKLDTYPQERFIVVYLSAKLKPVGYETISIGGINASFAHPREVFRGAILNNAYSIIVAHNHPSGDPTPSGTDIDTSRTLKSAGEVIGISVLDHIIIGEDDYYSLREHHIVFG